MSPTAAVAGAEHRPGEPPAGSRFFTNHAHVLMCLAEDPGMRIRDIADRVGVRDRAVTRILRDLVADGCVVRSRVGRRSHYFVVPDPPLAHPLERHLSLEPLIAAVRTPATGPGADPGSDDDPPRLTLEECRGLLATEAEKGWPNLGAALAAEYGSGWRALADGAADLLDRRGRTQRGHDGTELVLLVPRPWQTVIATFVDGALVGLSAECVETVVARARRGALAEAHRVAPALWDGVGTAAVGLLGVALGGTTGGTTGDWVIVDHTGRRVLATPSWPGPGADVDDDGDDVPYALVRQAVPGGGVVAVGCRRAGLAYDLTRRHPLVLVGATPGGSGGEGS